MAMICERNGEYLIGQNFADCVAGEYKSHGSFRKTTGRQELFLWRSTYNCVDSERILRKSIKDALSSFSFFTSQAL